MAKLVAGIFSTPSGHNNGLIFGKARTPDGKKTTVREYVKPTNPNTVPQQNQRTIFSYSVSIAKQMTPDLNALGWDRAVKQLPNFQSWVSLLMDNISQSTGMVSVPEPVTLGNLHFPDTFSASVGTDAIDLTWSTELGTIGNSDDIAHVVAFSNSPNGDVNPYNVTFDDSVTRADSTVSVNFPGASTGNEIVVLWFENSQTGASGAQKFSLAQFISD